MEDKINKDDNNNEQITKELFKKQEELNQIRETTINGHILRSKAVKVENNEKNTKYFANLEKKHAEKKTLYKLKIDNKIITGVQNTLTLTTNKKRRNATKPGFQRFNQVFM